MLVFLFIEPTSNESESDFILTPRKVKVELDLKKKGKGKPKAMDKFQGYLVDYRSLNGFLRRNDLDMLVRTSKSFLPHGFESSNEGRVISLYSCPHIVTKTNTTDNSVETSHASSQQVELMENTGAILRFDKPKPTEFQVLPFLSRLEDDENDNVGSHVFY